MYDSLVKCCLSSVLHLRRLKNLDVVSREVDRLIRAHPVAFIDIPDAAQVRPEVGMSLS